MPSYFLSETLKYLYLLFTDFQFFKVDGSSGDNQATSKEVVFTTEGHLLRIELVRTYVTSRITSKTWLRNDCEK